MIREDAGINLFSREKAQKTQNEKENNVFFF